jgi:hypothetical protein
MYQDSYIGAFVNDIVNDQVDITKCNSANIQSYQLVSRVNYLKALVENIQSQFVITKTPNKILMLDGNAEFIANINNDQVLTKNLIIDNITESYINTLATTNLRSDSYKLNLMVDGNLNKIELFTPNHNNSSLVQVNANANSANKLLAPINIVGDSSNNIIMDSFALDGTEDITVKLTLKDQEVVTTNANQIPFDPTDVYYAFTLTSDARIKRAWSTISTDALTSTPKNRFVSDNDITVWNNKVDDTFIPASINSNTNSNYHFNFNSVPNALPYTTLKSSDFGIKSDINNTTYDHGFRFDTIQTSNGITSKIHVNFLNNFYELYGTHNFDPSKYATLVSPTLTGLPTAPTAPVTLNSTSLQIANLSYVFSAIQKADEDKWQKYQDTIDFLLNNKHNTYNANDCIIYHDIFTAKTQQVITKGDMTSEYDETSYATTLWNKRKLIKYGSSAIHDFKVNMPIEYDIVWLRVTNDRVNLYGTFHSTSAGTGSADSAEYYARYAGGYRNLITFTPDGGMTDSSQFYHKWVPIPIDKNNPNNQKTIILNNVTCLALTLYGGTYKDSAGTFVPGDNWISGIAFSKNPFKHTSISARGIYWAINNSEHSIGWNSDNWNSDNLAYFVGSTASNFRIPVIDYLNETEDRLIYIIGHKDNWQNGSHTSLKCNGQPIERLRTTYINPFAKHYNSQRYSNYMAARLPASLIANSNGFLTFTIDRTTDDEPFYFREIGIHKFIA